MTSSTSTPAWRQEPWSNVICRIRGEFGVPGDPADSEELLAMADRFRQTTPVLISNAKGKALTAVAPPARLFSTVMLRKTNKPWHVAALPVSKQNVRDATAFTSTTVSTEQDDGVRQRHELAIKHQGITDRRSLYNDFKDSVLSQFFMRSINEVTHEVGNNTTTKVVEDPESAEPLTVSGVEHALGLNFENPCRRPTLR